MWFFPLKIMTSVGSGGELKNGFVEVFNENQTEKKSIN